LGLAVISIAGSSRSIGNHNAAPTLCKSVWSLALWTSSRSRTTGIRRTRLVGS